MSLEPAWEEPRLTLYAGDCREVLAELPAESVHCVVTSPPYWGLRDYGVGGQLGLEPTPEEYVANMVAVFREVRRVLRKDGTLWLNLGDSYGSGTSADRKPTTTEGPDVPASWSNRSQAPRNGLKPKDLVGIPWRVAFALQADGWYLRSDIIWSKPNPMPESVTDRPTKAHEYLFLLSKSARYWYDAEAVREPHMMTSGATATRIREGAEKQGPKFAAKSDDYARVKGDAMHPAGRNLRSVWTIATEPYPGAHFATFPRKLVEPCVKAGTSERGVCPECGAPWVRVVAVSPLKVDRDRNVGGREDGYTRMGGGQKEWDTYVPPVTTGWSAFCGCMAPPDDPRYFDGSLPDDDHPRPEPVPAVVLDPFAGSGTTLLVAQALGRRGIGIDLNPDYLRQAMRRASRQWGVGGRALEDDGSAAAPEGSLWEAAG